MKRTQQTTLDAAGYTYNPFTQANIWGQPTPMNLTALTTQELPLGQDDSGIPQMTAPHLRKNYAGGSDPTPEFTDTAPARKAEDDAFQRTVSLGVFGLIMALAMYSSLP